MRWGPSSTTPTRTDWIAASISAVFILACLMLYEVVIATASPVKTVSHPIKMISNQNTSFLTVTQFWTLMGCLIVVVPSFITFATTTTRLLTSYLRNSNSGSRICNQTAELLDSLERRTVFRIFRDCFAVLIICSILTIVYVASNATRQKVGTHQVPMQMHGSTLYVTSFQSHLMHTADFTFPIGACTYGLLSIRPIMKRLKERRR